MTLIAPMIVTGPPPQVAAKLLRDEMLMLTSNIATLIAERGLKEPRQVLGLVNPANYPNLAKQVKWETTVLSIAAAVFQSAVVNPRAAAALTNASKTTGGLVPVKTGLRNEFDRMVAEMLEVMRDLDIRTVLQLTQFVQIERAYPNLAAVVSNPRAMVAEVADILVNRQGNGQLLHAVFQRHTGETVAGYHMTVGFGLGDAALIAEITTSLLPAITQDQKVLQVANLVKAGLSVATAADAGSISDAIKAGSQAAKGAASLIGVNNKDLTKVLNVVQAGASAASPFEAATRVADTYRDQLISNKVDPKQAQELRNTFFQQELQKQMEERKQQAQAAVAKQPSPQPGPLPLPSNGNVPVPRPLPPLPGNNTMPTNVNVLPPSANNVSFQPPGPINVPTPPSNVRLQNAVPTCNSRNAGPCRQSYSPLGTIESRGSDQTCCRARPTGRGVLIAEYAGDSDLWPGSFWEAPAGDYYYIACQQATKLTPEYGQIMVPGIASPGSACIRTRGKSISSIVVPEEWAVELYSEPNFGGERTELFEGDHNLAALGWSGRVFSMKVRGPWTVVDGMIYNALHTGEREWVTEVLRNKPDPRNVVNAILEDPRRPDPPEYFDDKIPVYRSSYSPNEWQRLLSLVRKGTGGATATRLRRGFQLLGIKV